MTGDEQHGLEPCGRRKFLVAAFVSAIGFGCRNVESGPSASSGVLDISIENVWSLPTFGTVAAAQRLGISVPSDGGTRVAASSNVTAVVYCTIKNRGRTPERLLGASSAVAAAVEFHETTIERGIARMRPIGFFDIPGGGQIEFTPTKLHMMLVDLQRELQPGERFPLTLRFEHAGVREVQSEVRT